MVATTFSTSSSATAPGNSSTANWVLSNGNLTAAQTPHGGVALSITDTIGFSSTNYYWEITITAVGTITNVVGIVKSGESINVAFGSTSGVYGYGSDGKKYNNGSSSTYGNTFTTGDVIGVAYNATSGIVWFSKNGAWQNSATLVEIAAGTTTHAAYSSIAAGTYYPGAGEQGTNGTMTVTGNFDGPFTFPVPNTFTAVNGNNQIALTGVAATGSVGTVTASVNPATTTGVAATGSVGTITPNPMGVITGVSATGAVGTVTITSSVAGVFATGAVGTVTPSIATHTLTGVFCTGAVGSAAVNPEGIIVGVFCTGQVGQLFPVPPAPLHRPPLYIPPHDDYPATIWAGD